MLSHTWTRIALSYAALVLVMGGLLAFFLGGEFEGVKRMRCEHALPTRLARSLLAPLRSSWPPLPSLPPTNWRTTCLRSSILVSH